MSIDLTEAVGAAAAAYFNRIQAARRDDGRKRADGELWQWSDLSKADQYVARIFVLPLVNAAMPSIAKQAVDGERERIKSELDRKLWTWVRDEDGDNYLAADDLMVIIDNLYPGRLNRAGKARAECDALAATVAAVTVWLDDVEEDGTEWRDLRHLRALLTTPPATNNPPTEKEV